MDSKSMRMMGGDSKISAVPSKIHSALDYRARLQSDPRYELSDIYPQTGQRELTLNESSEQYVEFELPPRCVNLSRSVLEFGLDVSLENKTAGAIVPVEADQAIRYAADTLSFLQRIEIFSRTGVRLMDLQHQQLWSKLSSSWFTTRDHYEVKQQPTYAPGTGGGDLPFNSVAAHPWQIISKDISLQTEQNNLVGSDGLAEVGIHGNIMGAGALGTIAQNETRQVYRKYYIDLAKLRESILSVDKSLYFGGQVLMIKLTMAPFKTFLSMGDTRAGTLVGTRISSGAAKTAVWTASDERKEVELEQNIGEQFKSSPGDVVLNAADVKVTVKMDEIALRCAFETNPVIISQIKSKVMSSGGLKLFVPYVHTFKESRSNPSSGKCSVITRLNRGYGLRLQRMITTVTPELGGSCKTGSQESLYGISSIYQKRDDNKYVSDKPIFKGYYTTLNNRRLQERDIVILDSNNRFTADYWNQHKKLAEGSVIEDGVNALDKFCHIDSFDSYSPKKEDFSNVVAGLPLSDDMQYTINADLGANANVSQANVYTFAVVQRALQLRPDSITLV